MALLLLHTRDFRGGSFARGERRAAGDTEFEFSDACAMGEGRIATTPASEVE